MNADKNRPPKNDEKERKKKMAVHVSTEYYTITKKRERTEKCAKFDSMIKMIRNHRET